MKQIAKVRVNPDLAINQPYLDTNTSKLVENTKAFEWSIIKELGKMTRVTSG